MREDGSRTTSADQVADAFVGYFEELLGSRGTTDRIDPSVLNLGPKVGEEVGVELSAQVSDKEIKEAMFSIGDDKSPGPDGFSSVFFKKAWNVVGPSVCEATKEFFRNSSLLKQVNHTAIALIPKSTHASKVSDYRPISLCNVTYKVITKILTARLSPIIGTLVDQAQGAFVPGRLMSDNIHLMQELLRGYNRKRVSPRCTIKVDIRKAYDTVSWTFVREVLTGLGFPSVFVGWIMECISSPTYSVSINGGLHGFFKGKRGLRQGDPLSPYLFILCLEYLSRKLKQATDGTDFNYHPSCDKLKITHLAFADDLMLVSRGDPISIGILLDCMEDFGKKSGLRLNVSKSAIYTAGIEETIVQDIREASNLLRGDMPFRYLGIPLAAAKLKAAHFSPLCDQITNRIKGWKGVSLSYAGRAELISSVIQGIESFWCGIFFLPTTIRQLITKLCRDFFWGGKGAMVAWTDICKPKNEGGLGFRDLKAWNLAILSKVAWNISAKKDSLWIRWVNHVYLKDKDFWEWEVHVRDSPLLKILCRIKTTILEATASREEAMALLKDWFGGVGGNSGHAYDFFRTVSPRKPWAREVWCPISMPRHSVVLWLATLGRLKTKDRVKMGVEDPKCCLCKDKPESSVHLFFECQVSYLVWKKVRAAFKIRRNSSTIASGLKWLKKEAKGTSWMAKGRRTALACTVYHLWNARNRKLFEDEDPEVDKIASTIITQVYRTLYTHYPHLEGSISSHFGAAVLDCR